MIALIVAGALLGASPELSEAERMSIWNQKPFTRPELPRLTKPVRAQTLPQALDSLKGVERAFVFAADGDCPVAARAAPVFEFVALMYGKIAPFYVVDPVRFKPSDGFRSPTVFYIEAGRIRDQLSGIWVPGVTSIEQVRIKNTYEGFVMRNLYGKRAGADFVFVLTPERARERTTGGMNNVYVENADYSGIVMRNRRVHGGVLRGADFRKADLQGTEFWGVDLLDALFEGARLDEVTWMGTICPDGFEVLTWSDNCRDHLIDGPAPKKRAHREPGRVGITHHTHK